MKNEANLGLCNIGYPFEMHPKPKTNEISLFITYFLVTQSYLTKCGYVETVELAMI